MALAGMLSAQKFTLCGPPLLLWKRITSPLFTVRVAGTNFGCVPSMTMSTSCVAPVAAGAAAVGAAVVVSVAAA